MALHQDEIPVDEGVVRELLCAQRPEWASLSLSAAGAGTENTMFRLGRELLVRLPRTVAKGEALRTEQTWLPRLAPHLDLAIPEPVHAGRPTAAFPVRWSVHRWIEGAEAGPDTVRDWGVFGGELASFVRQLHGVDLMGESRGGDLSWYRGGTLRDCASWVDAALDGCRAAAGAALDVDTLERLWRSALTLPDPAGPHVWLHGDLKPTNLLVQQGELHAVIDFGALSIGHPDAEHAAIWDLPAAARDSYWAALGLDPAGAVWQRARAWAVAVGVSGVSYYWDSFPAFVAECLARLEAILRDTAGRE